METTMPIDFIIFYLVVGYIVNNIIGLIALYGSDGDVEVDFGAFLLTIPVWPYTLFSVIAALLSKD